MKLLLLALTLAPLLAHADGPAAEGLRISEGKPGDKKFVDASSSRTAYPKETLAGGPEARALAARGNQLQPFNLPWDPPSLENHWFARRGNPSTPPPPLDCGRAMRAIVLTGYFGQTNNMLMEVVSALDLAVTAPEPTVLVTHGTREMKQIDNWFSWDGLKSWACLAQAVPAGAAVTRYTMFDVFWIDRNNSFTRAANSCTRTLWFSVHDKGLVLGQILLRPVPKVREEVEAFLTAHGLRDGYVAIHVRSFSPARKSKFRGRSVLQLTRVEGRLRELTSLVQEGRSLLANGYPGTLSLRGAALGRAVREWPIPALVYIYREVCRQTAHHMRRISVNSTHMPGNRKVTPNDVCLVSDDYIAAALDKDRVPREWPIVVVHDHKPRSSKRAEELRLSRGAIPSTLSVPGDMLLLAKSSYLFANPASTFSGVVANGVRWAYGASAASSTLDQGLWHSEGDLCKRVGRN